MSDRLPLWLALPCLLVAYSASAQEPDELHQIDADLWADNWFALYRQDELLAQDSVAYNTERSFNSESFSFSATLPAQFSLIIKDFKEYDTGLEYIGSRCQQMGDGGFIAQFFDAANGKLLAVSDDSWKCIAIHRAPLNRSCERAADPEQQCSAEILPEPEHWKRIEYDDRDWPQAVVHPASAVRPHGGFSDIEWQSSAKLIWSDDLEIDNTVLCRFTLGE